MLDPPPDTLPTDHTDENHRVIGGWLLEGHPLAEPDVILSEGAKRPSRRIWEGATARQFLPTRFFVVALRFLRMKTLSVSIPLRISARIAAETAAPQERCGSVGNFQLSTSDFGLLTPFDGTPAHRAFHDQGGWVETFNV